MTKSILVTGATEFIDSRLVNSWIDKGVFLAKAVLGSNLIKLLITHIKISNKKILKIYDFKYPNYKDGIKQVVSVSELKSKNRI